MINLKLQSHLRQAPLGLRRLMIVNDFCVECVEYWLLRPIKSIGQTLL